MLNNDQLNQNPIGYSALIGSISADVISFDGYGLQNANIITSEIDFDDLTQVELNAYKFPRDNGGGVLSKFYRGRTIKVKCTLKASDSASFATLLDSFKKGLSTTEGNLDITVGSEARRIKATCTAIDFGRQHYNVTFATAAVTFQTAEPFFYSTSAQSFEFLASANTFSGEFTNAGSANANPLFVMIFGAGTSATNIAVTAFGKTINIAGTYAQNDLVMINSATKSVTKNGTDVDYTGQFPVMKPGSCPFTVTMTGASLMDMTIVVPKNYL